MSGNTKEIQIVRQLSLMEKGLCLTHQDYGINGTVDSVHVRSVKPLQDHQVMTALGILQKKFQHLRVCVMECNKKMFFYENADPQIDYQRVEGGDWQWIHEELLCKKYDLKRGPLWCCRLMPLNKNSPDLKIGAYSELSEPYVLMFGHLHSITDGVSNMNLCGNFLRILNNVIEGVEINEATLNMFPSTNDLVSVEASSYHIRDVFPLSKLVHDYIFPQTNYFARQFESPKDIKARTRMIFREISEKDTSRFIKRCKSEGCTFHGAFTVIAAMVMCDMVEKAKVYPQDVSFKIGHAVNLRKFIDTDMTDAYGFYIAYMLHNFIIRKNARAEFWEYAKEYTINLHADLDKGKHFESNRLIHLILTDTFLSMQKRHNISELEFATTNMGFLDPYFNKVGKHLEAVAVFRSAAFHYMGVNFLHSIQTFKGRINYNLDYFPNYVTTKLANEYADRIIRTLIEVSEY